MTRIPPPDTYGGQINDLARRVAALERRNPLTLASVDNGSGDIAWSAAHAASGSVSAWGGTAAAPQVSTSATAWNDLGSFRWVAAGLTPSASVPVYVIPPTGGTCKVRLLDTSGPGAVIAEQDGIASEGYVVLRGQIGTATGAYGDVYVVDVQVASDGSGSMTARLDATASIH